MSVAPRIKVKALTRACYPACRLLLLLWLNTERPHAPWITAIRGLQPLLHLFNQCLPAVPPDNTFAASPVKAISSHSFNPRPSFPAPTEKFPSARAATELTERSRRKRIDWGISSGDRTARLHHLSRMLSCRLTDGRWMHSSMFKVLKCFLTKR